MGFWEAGQEGLRLRVALEGRGADSLRRKTGNREDPVPRSLSPSPHSPLRWPFWDALEIP